MKWAEVIMVRSAGGRAEILDATLQDLMNAVDIESYNSILYNLSTDY